MASRYNNLLGFHLNILGYTVDQNAELTCESNLGPSYLGFLLLLIPREVGVADHQVQVLHPRSA